MLERIVYRADVSGFRERIRKIGSGLRDAIGQRDIRHLQKIERIGRLCTFTGLMTAWVLPNPISAFLIAQGMMVRFTMGHHIGHGAYDRIPGVPKKYKSKIFARGWRRFIDWPEWWTHDAWLHLHNRLHHPNTQDKADADLMDPKNFVHIWLPLRHLLLAFFTMTWKFSYYGPYMEREWLRRCKREHRSEPYRFKAGDLLNPLDPATRNLLVRRYLPYIIYRFVMPTAIFLPLGVSAAFNVFIAMVMAELIHNTQTFICIRSSHCAPDLPLFSSPGWGRRDYCARQVLATANYNGGGDLMDILHGWTNYQIEHHLWPNATLLQQQKVRRAVKQACAETGLPYIQQNVLKRYWLMSKIFLGLSYQPTMHIMDTAP